MAILNSDLFRGDARLEACATTPAQHVLRKVPPEKGEHVARIQAALADLQPDAEIDDDEMRRITYGRTTANAVKAYKTQRGIINHSYQDAPDDIVGQMTVVAMDKELQKEQGARDAVVDQAFKASRDAVRRTLFHLNDLRDDVNAQLASGQPNPSGMLKLLKDHARDIEVLRRRLMIISPDPTSQEFRDALDKVIRVIEKNAAQPKTLLAAGFSGMCNPTLAQNAGGVPFAWTLASAPPPRCHLCEPFFDAEDDLQRDIVTHELCHLFGLEDIAVNNTNQALRNANTIAQVVALINDRFRQANSDGNEQAIPLLPSP